MDDAFMGDGDLHGSPSVPGLDHLISLLLQELAGKVAQVGFVLGEEDGFRTRLSENGFLGGDDLGDALGSFGDSRQINLERRAFAGLARNPDVVAALFGDSVDRGETEAGSLA